MKTVFFTLLCYAFVFLHIFLDQISGENSTNVLERRNVRLGEFPWFAAIYKHTVNDSKVICGATIISPLSLLSAADCFYDSVNNLTANASDYEIAVGKITNDRDSYDSNDTRFYNIREIISNDYNRDSVNEERNIVILVTEEEISFNSHVSPACLFETPNPVIPDSAKLNFAGFKFPENDNPYNLTAIQLPFLRSEECANFVLEETSNETTTDKFCAGYKNATIFGRGDCGSGLVLENAENSCPYLLGISNFLIDGEFGILISTFVPTYFSWITENINGTYSS